MVGRKTTLLQAVLVGLAVGSASGALVVGDGVPWWGDPDELLQSLTDVIILDSAATLAETTPADPCPSDPPHDEEQPAIVWHAEGLIPGGPAASNSSSQSNGGSTGGALTAAAPYLPEIFPQGSLPPEPKTILPTGPPFKLLRPA